MRHIRILAIILLEYMVMYKSPMLLACAILSCSYICVLLANGALLIVVANLHQYVFAL